MLSTPTLPSFSKRKREHIALALSNKNQTSHLSMFDQIHLMHQALPDIDFTDISIKTTVLGKSNPTPFFVSSMTAGHDQAKDLNYRIAKFCGQRGWLMGVGSQRRELTDSTQSNEWQAIKQLNPKPRLLGNLGIAQLIHATIEQIQRLVDHLEAEAMIIHWNALQECLQPEGTPYFKQGITQLTHLCKALPLPVIVKETGCGFSKQNLKQLMEIGVYAVDISGTGGTHWGRIEGERNPKHTQKFIAAHTFKNWGIDTVSCLLFAKAIPINYALWASGGVRSGLDAAKAFVLGANMVGFAKPILEVALVDDEALDHLMATYEFELKVAMFCTGSPTIEALKQNEYYIHS